MKSTAFFVSLLLTALVSCSKPEPEEGATSNGISEGILPAVEAVPETQSIGRDTIPDFSTVGYRWGERDFPTSSYAVVNLPAPGGGSLGKYNFERIRESGIEDLVLESDYDAATEEKSPDTDIFHACSAIIVRSAEHCWVKNVETRFPPWPPAAS